MADLVKICALGGLDEKGRDCYIVEINNDIFVLDCGISLPDKTLPGVDCMMPNYDYLVKNKDRVKAYLISHGHDESMAAVKYICDKVPAPIYCSRATRISMEAQAFIHHFKPNFHFVEVNPSDKVMISGHEVRFFQVPHNVANSSGVAIWCDRGWIIYTSDFIIDFSVNEPNYQLDVKALNEIASRPTFALLAESKAVNRSGYCSPNHKSKGLIESYFKDNKRIFISSTWQNAYRIQEIIKLCRKYNKKLYPYDEYCRVVLAQFNKAEIDLLKGVEVLGKEDLLRVRANDVVILIIGMGDELYEETKRLSRRENFDSRIVLGKDDIFINAALPLPMQETLCTRSVDSLYRTGCQVVWLKSKDITSMHAQKDDLKYMLSLLRPKFYLPVRGNFVNMMTNARLALNMEIGLNHMNVFVLDNGMQVVWEEQLRPRIIPNEVNGINVAPMLVDGNGISQSDDAIISDRVKLSEDGVVVIAATVSESKKEIIAGPDCQMRGFVYVKEAEPLLKSVSAIFIDEINTHLQLEKFDIDDTILQVQDRAKKFIKRENGREPYILPIIQMVE